MTERDEAGGPAEPGPAPARMPVHRRAFLATGSTALLAAVGLPIAAPFVRRRRVAYDLVLRGGTVFDGTGAPGRPLDVAITGDRIAAIGARLAEGGREEIDLRGLAVAPGFVDIHSHGDGTLDDDWRAESVVRQGISTIVVGADGSSRADGSAERPFAERFRRWDALRPGCNVASMVGLGTVRGAVVGNDDRPATPAELARMVAMVEAALADGACGASSGLEYTPGAFAALDELVALCRPLAAHGRPYATHLRNEDDRLLEALDEAIAVARGAGCALQVSHLKTQGPRNWGKLDDAFARIAGARTAGVDAAFDRYPYVAYSTGLANLFPVWSRDGGTDAFLARLQDPVLATRLREAVLAKVALIGGWDNVQVSGVRAAEDRAAEGRRLGEYAASEELEPYDCAVGLLLRSRGDVGMLGFAMSEANLDRILAHPLGMVCTDGGAFAVDGPTRRGSPHPRGAGSFPRVLAQQVRLRRVLTLEQAIAKMTSIPAARVRLADRGRLAPALAADVVAFDPATVEDRATFEQPFQYPVGIPLVVVNGAVALRDGHRGAVGSGRSVRAAG
jgi:N-acyl-D-aspartate/D-glutamate deacylase